MACLGPTIFDLSLVCFELPSLGYFGLVFGHLELPCTVLGLSWAVLGLSWAFLGLSWACLGLSWFFLGCLGHNLRFLVKLVRFVIWGPFSADFHIISGFVVGSISRPSGFHFRARFQIE